MIPIILIHVYNITLRIVFTFVPIIIRHVNNIPTMQLFTGISRNNQSKSYMLPLTECVWEFRNNALWDTHSHALILVVFVSNGRVVLSASDYRSTDCIVLVETYIIVKKISPM